jgi:hypothetical protein
VARKVPGTKKPTKIAKEGAEALDDIVREPAHYGYLRGTLIKTPTGEQSGATSRRCLPWMP